MKQAILRSALAAGLAAGTALAAQAQEVQGVTDTEVLIGHNGDLSGIFAPFNVQAVKAAQLLFDKVNAEGGIHGRQIKLIAEDHGYQVPKAVQNFNKLINSDKVFAMILNLGTPHNIAGFKMMEPKKIANVSPLTSARQMIEGDISYKYAGLSSYYDQLRAGVNFLHEQDGSDVVCAMYIPSDFGLEIKEGTEDEVEELGLDYAAETTHKPDEQDFVGSLTKLRDAGCEIVATALGVRQTIVVLGTAKKLGWDNMSFIGSSAAFNTAVAKVPGGVTEGYYAAAGWSDLEARMEDTPELKEWAEEFKATFDEEPGTAAQLGYGAANTVVLALEAAGPELTPETFREGMESIDVYDPILDVQVEYGPDDHQGGDTVIISQIKDGMWHEVGRQ